MQRLRLPLLHDHHSHGSLYAALGGCPDLSDQDEGGGREILRGLPSDRLTLVRGRRSSVLPLGPDDLRSLPPALILDFSLHGYLVTDAALPFLREAAPEISDRRADKEWMERSVSRLFAAYVKIAGLDREKVGAFLAGLEALGTGSTEDMSVSAEALRIIKRTAFAERFAFWTAPEEYLELSADERAGVRGVKLYLDGSLGARTAAIAGRYLDTGGEGLLTYADEALEETLSVFAPAAGLALHAIGERAIDQALACLARLDRAGVRRRGVRLEHVQFITKAQARAAKDLGLVLSMQPNFTSDSIDYADRLDPGRRAANNPFRTLLDEAGFIPGEDLLFGSDGMPHGPACAFGQGLFPSYPDQVLTVDELVAGYGEARDGARARSFELILDEEKRTVQCRAGRDVI